jgi:hypothetical protein
LAAEHRKTGQPAGKAAGFPGGKQKTDTAPVLKLVIIATEAQHHDFLYFSVFQ